MGNKQSQLTNDYVVAVETALNRGFNLETLATVKDSDYKFTIDGDEYVLCVAWTDWRPYMSEVNDPNKVLNRAQPFACNSTGSDGVLKQITYKRNQFNQNLCRAQTTWSKVWLTLYSEVAEDVKKLKDARKNNNTITEFLKSKFGFPDSHKTSVAFTTLLVKSTDLVRPATPSDPNNPEVLEPNNNNIGTEQDSDVKNFMEHKFLEIEWSKDNAFPWSGTGYTIHWKTKFHTPEYIRMGVTNSSNPYKGYTEFLAKTADVWVVPGAHLNDFAKMIKSYDTNRSSKVANLFKKIEGGVEKSIILVIVILLVLLLIFVFGTFTLGPTMYQFKQANPSEFL